jgi:hypothetical protein
MITFRGWGWMVLVIFFLWFGVVLYAGFSMGWLGSTKDSDNTLALKATAATSLLNAASIWAISTYRERDRPGRDYFCYVPMKYWPRILLVVAIATFIASFFSANSQRLS